MSWGNLEIYSSMLDVGRNGLLFLIDRGPFKVELMAARRPLMSLMSWAEIWVSLPLSEEELPAVIGAEDLLSSFLDPEY